MFIKHNGPVEALTLYDLYRNWSNSSGEALREKYYLASIAGNCLMILGSLASLSIYFDNNDIRSSRERMGVSLGVYFIAFSLAIAVLMLMRIIPSDIYKEQIFLFYFIIVLSSLMLTLVIFDIITNSKSPIWLRLIEILACLIAIHWAEKQSRLPLFGNLEQGNIKHQYWIHAVANAVIIFSIALLCSYIAQLFKQNKNVLLGALAGILAGIGLKQLENVYDDFSKSNIAIDQYRKSLIKLFRSLTATPNSLGITKKQLIQRQINDINNVVTAANQSYLTDHSKKDLFFSYSFSIFFLKYFTIVIAYENNELDVSNPLWPLNDGYKDLNYRINSAFEPCLATIISNSQENKLSSLQPLLYEAHPLFNKKRILFCNQNGYNLICNPKQIMVDFLSSIIKQSYVFH